MNRIGLIGAMPMEVAPFLEYLEHAREECEGPLKFHTGNLWGVPVVVGCCGISKVNAAMGTQAMIQRYHPRLIIHTGVAGALSQQLKIGDVVVARGCVQYDVDTSAIGDPVGFVSTVNRILFECDAELSGAIVEACRLSEERSFAVHSGVVSTGDRFLSRGEDKRWIEDTFGALTCDQESCAVAQVCCVNCIPMAVIRAVSDASDGAHAAEYETYMPMAAQNAAAAAMWFLEKSGKHFL